MSQKLIQGGQQWGWVAGFVGGACWIPFVAYVLLVNSHVFIGIFALVCFGLFPFVLLRYLPWQHPNKKIWKLFLLTIAPIVVSTLGMLVGLALANNVPLITLLQFAFIIPLLFIPLVSFGKKTWNELSQKM